MKTSARFLRRIGWAAAVLAFARGAELPSPVASTREGALRYLADAQGNRVPDFSHAGYGGGGVALPYAPARITVAPGAGDDGPAIQAAIDRVSRLDRDRAGLRGAVILQKGRYEIAGTIKLHTTGVVLRGEGKGEDGTVLVATGDDRRTLVEIAGKGQRAFRGEAVRIEGDYLPVGARALRMPDRAPLKVGDRVLVQRPSPAAWLTFVGMDDAPSRPPLVWEPGAVNIAWERVVTGVRENEITVDAPLTTALEQRFGGGSVQAFDWPGQVEQVGIENLRCVSAFDAANPEDEEHAWIAISIDKARDAWVRDVVAAHFVSSAVDVRAGASRVTVQDCAMLEPISELAGYRRHSFHTTGQLTLFQRCSAREGQHDFTVGYLAAGPNAFVRCEAQRTNGFSGSIGSWASGVLFDNVKIDGGELALDNLEDWNQDVGWAAANSMLWQSVASRMTVRAPPGAQNWAVGVWSQFRGNGRWSALNDFVEPQSLYEAQLAERVGAAAASAALKPAAYAPTMADRIEDSTTANASNRPAGVIVGETNPALAPLTLRNGWLLTGDRVLAGRQVETPTWRGHLLPVRAPERGLALTRFAPGRVGLGWTDDLLELTASLGSSNVAAIRHHWGLWYDQRRGDHQMIRRLNGDVWPPFFEQPWARTGPGKTWNGLNRYDLTKFNPWYFKRLREFATLAQGSGRVLVNEMYFQHNILEAGAHWADFPWRPANCIQETGFPEPPEYVEEKRVFMAEQFYDVSHAVRRELHRAYIRHSLGNLGDLPNVIHTVGDEYTGPLHFVQFWLDVVAEWMAETGKRPLIAISATKDVLDAILADPKRSALISVIDLKYWWATDSGVHAPKGGENLSPRQHERLWKGGRPSAASIAGMVREYRMRYPEKAVMAGLPEADGWFFAAAGGSMPKLPSGTDPSLLAALARLRPAVGSAGQSTAAWILGGTMDEFFIFAPKGGPISLPLTQGGRIEQRTLDLDTGKVKSTQAIMAETNLTLTLPAGAAAAVWITR